MDVGALTWEQGVFEERGKIAFIADQKGWVGFQCSQGRIDFISSKNCFLLGCVSPSEALPWALDAAQRNTRTGRARLENPQNERRGGTQQLCEQAAVPPEGAALRSCFDRALQQAEPPWCSSVTELGSARRAPQR